jgi:endoglucanase
MKHIILALGLIIGCALLAPSPASAQCPGAACLPLPSGYLSVRGRQLVDGLGNQVRLSCVQDNEGDGSFGEMQQIRAAGFNCIRVSYWDRGWITNTSMGLPTMDAYIANAAANNLRVIFDHHGNEGPYPDGASPCWGAQQNGLPYDVPSNIPVGGIFWNTTNGTDGCSNPGTITYAQYKANIVAIAAHYVGNPTLIGLDMHNEPNVFGAGVISKKVNWGGNNGSDIRAACIDTGGAIHAANAGLLTICEGIINFTGTFLDGTPMSSVAGAGANGIHELSLAGSMPVTGLASSLVYSVHVYPSNLSASKPHSGNNAVAFWNHGWGYLIKNNIAPVWLGESGCSCDNSNGAIADDQAYANTLTSYVNGGQGANGGPTYSGTEQPQSAAWLMWGSLPGQNPNGTNNPDGTLKGQLANNPLRFSPGTQGAYFSTYWYAHPRADPVDSMPLRNGTSR